MEKYTRERVEVYVSPDEMEAFVTLNMLESEISSVDKTSLIIEIMNKLSEHGVIYGLKKDVIHHQLRNNGGVLIAEGTPPENGEDSISKMYELKEPKPEITEDGNANHYELNLINTINQGEWLGERTDPTPGKPGMSVKGNPIAPIAGKCYPIIYDSNSVMEVYENGVTTLYSKRNGAVHYDGDKISVSNLMEIPDDVNFKTGNLDFNGYLKVRGSVEDNFSVIANKDIEVLGEYGVGSVREISSREGSVYIKGGIAGKNKAVIKSKKDIYTKFISDAYVMCEGSVHIGFYCLNSKIIAKEVILDSHKGQIIGGEIQAEIRVVSSIIGSNSEKKTIITVKGFDRKDLRLRLENVTTNIELIRKTLDKNKKDIEVLTRTTCMSSVPNVIYRAFNERLSELKKQIRNLEDERKALLSFLRTHGEGEIAVLKKVYPGTTIEIKKQVKEFSKPALSTTFYVQDGMMREI